VDTTMTNILADSLRKMPGYHPTNTEKNVSTENNSPDIIGHVR